MMRNLVKIGRYTPGPWKTVRQGHGPIDIVEPTGRYVVTVYGGIEPGSFLANASLISAAPDLLEALYDLRAFVAVMVSHGPDARIPETIATPLGARVKIGLIMDNATAAISKAEGSATEAA